MAELSILQLAVALAVAAIAYRLVVRKPASPYPLPPGPPKSWIPFVGNTFQLMDQSTIFPTKLGKWNEEYGEIVCLEGLFGAKTIVLGSHRAAKELLDVRGSNYSSRVPMPMLRDFICRQGNIAFEPYGESWRRLRRETHRELNISNVRQYAWIQEREAYILAQGLCERDPKDLLVLTERFGGAIGLGAVYDMPVHDYHNPVIEGFNRVLEGKLKMLIPGNSYYDLLPWFRWVPEWVMPSKRTARIIREESERTDIEMREYVERRMASGEGTSSLLASLLQRAKEGDTDLSPFLIDSLPGSLMAAAGDTSSATVHLFILALICKPDLQQKLQAYIDHTIGRDRMPCSDDLDHLPYVRAFVLEALRWRGIARFGVPHCNVADDTFESNGKTYFIPAGSQVIGNAWAMDRDKDMFPEPEEVRPERYLHKDGSFNSSIPIFAFGFGRRVCPGQNLAINSLIMVVSCLAWSFTFTKGRNADGTVIEPDLSSEAVHDGGNVYRPTKFSFEVTHRFPDVEKMIRATVKTSAASGGGR